MEAEFILPYPEPLLDLLGVGNARLDMLPFRCIEIFKLAIKQVPVAAAVTAELVLRTSHLQAGAAGGALQVDKIGHFYGPTVPFFVLKENSDITFVRGTFPYSRLYTTRVFREFEYRVTFRFV